MKIPYVIVIPVIAFGSTLALAAPADGQSDTFDGGDVNGWQQGFTDTVAGEADGGPLGAGDGYISATSTGGTGASSRMSVFNLDARWTGDWTGPNIVQVDVDLRNDSAAPLDIRLKIEGAATQVYSAAHTVPADGQWASYTFDVSTAALTGPGEPSTVLAAVTRFRFEHNPTGAHPPPTIQAVLSIDNVTAVAAALTCRNGSIDTGEICDGADLDGATCADFPDFDDGTLACSSNCMALDTRGCTRCGDGTCGGSENATSCPADCTRTNGGGGGCRAAGTGAFGSLILLLVALLPFFLRRRFK